MSEQDRQSSEALTALFNRVKNYVEQQLGDAYLVKGIRLDARTEWVLQPDDPVERTWKQTPHPLDATFRVKSENIKDLLLFETVEHDVVLLDDGELRITHTTTSQRASMRHSRT